MSPVSDKNKRIEARKRKVRKKQVESIDSTAVAVLALFPQLALVVSIP